MSVGAAAGVEIDPGGAEPRALLEAVGGLAQRVLEIGTGDGRLTFRFAAATRSVTGVDHDVAAVVRATGAGASSGRLSFLPASAVELPFRDGIFDVALLSSSL